MNKVCTLAVFCIFVLSTFAFAGGATFISGYSGGNNYYCVISFNGKQYRTDEMGPASNTRLWNELSEEDRQKVVDTYSWGINTRAAHFGSGTNSEIANWVNVNQGWTDAWDTMRSKWGEKAYPDLKEAFENGNGWSYRSLLIAPVNDDVLASDDYSRAVRIGLEIEAYYQSGHAIYTALANAKWDQVSVAVKGVSGPLIKTIIDNFMVNHITHGAKNVASELYAASYALLNEIEGKLEAAYTSAPRKESAADIIASLDQFLGQMETSAKTCLSRIQSLEGEFNSLCSSIAAADQTETQSKITDKAADELARGEYLENFFTSPVEHWDYNFPDGSQVTELGQAYAAALQEYHEKLAAMPDWVSETGAMHTELTNALTFVLPDWLTVDHQGDWAMVDQTGGVIPAFKLPLDEVDAKLQELQDLLVNLNESAETLAEFEARVLASSEAAGPHFEEVRKKYAALYSLYINVDDLIPEGNVLSLDPPSSFDLTSEDFVTKYSWLLTPGLTLADCQDEYAARIKVVEKALVAIAAQKGVRVERLRSSVKPYSDRLASFSDTFTKAHDVYQNMESYAATTGYFKQETGLDGVVRYSVDTNLFQAEIDAAETNEEKREIRLALWDKVLSMQKNLNSLNEQKALFRESHEMSASVIDLRNRDVASDYGYETMDFVLDKINRDYTPEFGYSFSPIDGVYGTQVAQGPTPRYMSGQVDWSQTDSVSPLYIHDLNQFLGMTDDYQRIAFIRDKIIYDRTSLLALSETGLTDFKAEVNTALNTASYNMGVVNVYGEDYPGWGLVQEINRLMVDLEAEYRTGVPVKPTEFTVRVSVVDSQGKAMAGAQVELRGPDNENDFKVRQVLTNTSGVVVFKELPPGTYFVIPALSDYEMSPPIETLKLEWLNADLTVTATKYPEPTMTLTGRLADLLTEEPISQAHVYFTTEEERVTLKATYSQADGSFILRGVPQVRGFLEIRQGIYLFESQFVYTPQENIDFGLITGVREYLYQASALHVKLLPEDLRNDFYYTIDPGTQNERLYNVFNANVTVDPGRRILSFPDVEGYHTPASIEVDLVDGQLHALVAEYRRKLPTPVEYVNEGGFLKTLVANWTDPDFGNVTEYLCEWTINGQVLAGFSGKELPEEMYGPGDTVGCRLIPRFTLEPENVNSVNSVVSGSAIEGPKLYFAELYPGWNMLAIPLEPKNRAIDDVFAEIRNSMAGPLWKWDSAANAYAPVEEIAPGRGFWLYATEKCSLKVKGIAASVSATHLEKGWSLSGGVGDAKFALPEITAGEEQTAPIYGWNALAKKYEIVDELIPKGSSCWFWRSAPADCRLVLDINDN